MLESKKSLISTLVITLVLALLVEHRIFTDPMAINDDLRNQLYWIAKLINPNYFANDYLADYFSQPSMISPIFNLIYEIGVQIVDPKLISQFLPFPILIMTIFYLYKFAELHAGSRFAFWLCFVFNLYIWAMKFIVGGLPRSCFYLLFFSFLYLLAKRRWLGLNICAALSALIYPTAFFLSWLTLVLELFWDRAKLERDKYQAALTTLTISLFILYFRYLYNSNHSFGSLYNIQEAITMPEFYYDHRHAVFALPSSVMELGSKPSLLLEWSVAILPSLLLVVIAILFGYWVLTRLILVRATEVKPPRLLWSSVIAALLLFIIAHIALFYLYLPHRFIAYVLPLIPVFFIATWFYQFEQLYSKKVYLLALLALVLMFPRFNDDLVRS